VAVMEESLNPHSSAHPTGIPFTRRPSDNPFGSRPWAMASTMSGASKVRRMMRLT